MIAQSSFIYLIIIVIIIIKKHTLDYIYHEKREVVAYRTYISLLSTINGHPQTACEEKELLGERQSVLES